MSYQEVVIDTFGGLNISDDPERVGWENASDSLNNDPSTPTKLRPRVGTATFTTVANPVITLSEGYGAYALMVATATDLYAFDEDGVQLATAASAVEVLSMVTYGTPVASAIYYNYGGLGIRKFNGAFSVVAASPPANYLAVTPNDNRLVAALDSTVWFSDAGAPETFGANSFVGLDPGDGEWIVGMTTWRDMLFVFKHTKFYVFTGTSTDSTGQPIFNYRAVKNTIGADPGIHYTHDRVCVAPDGVYFLSHDGIYRTTGEAPVKVSKALDAWFENRVDRAAAHAPLASAARLGIAADTHRLYLGTDGGTFVLDFETGAWTVWSFDVAAAATFTHIAGHGPVIADGHTVREIQEGSDRDDGLAFNYVYRTGLSDMGTPDTKTVRMLDAWGAGVPTIGVYADHTAIDAGEAPVTLGAGGATARNRQSFARVGSLLGVAISADSATTVNRLVVYVRETRLASVG